MDGDESDDDDETYSDESESQTKGNFESDSGRSRICENNREGYSGSGNNFIYYYLDCIKSYCLIIVRCELVATPTKKKSSELSKPACLGNVELKKY